MAENVTYEFARHQGIGDGISAVIAAVAEIYPDAAEWLASDDGLEAIDRALVDFAALAKRRGEVERTPLPEEASAPDR